MFLMNGDEDSVVHLTDYPPAWFDDMRNRAAALHGSEDGLFTTVRYPGVSHRTSWVNIDGMLWLNHQLHFSLWNDHAIRAAGTTHISSWIRANNVAISPNYIREDREGGIDAVGTGFPGIKRDDLMVFTTDEWKASESQLTYESWAAKIHLLEK
jgi:hypothetical protein